ncbi:MAG: aldo/keto reductase [Defluviitaleaceae bacterium]|nr:aldo/keto reductase [Defluviitaleaceae bacterium]
MQYRTDNKSGNALPALGMGCMRLPGTLGNADMAKTEAVIMEAIGLGINFFDTAYLYPGSEATLGTVLEKNNVRDKVYISTKLPLFKCHSYADFDRLFDTQLSRLKTDYVDYYFMHNMTKLADWERLLGLGIEKWLAEKKAQGKIRQVGFSFHGQKDEFTRLLDARDWDFCMIQYNYINVNYQAGQAGLQYAAGKGIPVFIMEPLLGGRLAKDLPEAAKKHFKQADPTATPAAWALRWLWNQPEVTMVLSGMNEIGQLTENIAIAEKSPAGNMTVEDLRVVDEVAQIFSASYKIPCTGCNYCLPCPVKINIPDSFMAYNASYSVNRMTGMQLYITTSGSLSRDFSVRDCIQCGKCEKLCPQEIKIMARLKDVGKRMEPWWYRGAMAVARRVMK